MGERGDGHDHRFPSKQQPPQRPLAPPAVAVVGQGSEGGISPSTFLSYVCIGFGCTVGLITIGVTMWLFYRRALQRRRARQEQAAAVAAQHDPRRAQAEAVQRMIAEKRKAAAAARTPFLVVHPGGDAMVAFKESSRAAGPTPDPREDLIKPYMGSRRGSAGGGSGGSTPTHAASAAPALVGGAAFAGAVGADQQLLLQQQQQAQALLMSRRALVAAAALSGRTSSGISDVLVDPSQEAAEADEAEANDQQQRHIHWQQQQQQPQPPRLHQTASGSFQHLLPPPVQQQEQQLAVFSSQQELQGAVPPSISRGASSGASSEAEDLSLLHVQQRRGPDPVRSDELV